MDLNGTFNFTGDARIEETQVQSYGVMTKFRQDFSDPLRTRLIVGVDLDYSPSKRKETKINLTSTLIGPNSLYTQYTGYTLGSRIYDYESTYTSAAPYAHLEMSPSEKLRVTMGLRYDYALYEMKNQMTPGFVAASGRQYYTSADASVDFSRLSPKLGATYQLSEQSHLYTSYNQGFRTPSESQLFRGGRSDTGALATQQAQARALSNAALNLKAIKAEQYELGFRGFAAGWNYDVVGYLLKKKDDLLSQKDSTGFAVQTNNGETEHKGIELGLGKTLLSSLRLDLAGSYAKHTYSNWVTSTVNYSGKEIEASPRLMANTRLTWKPAAKTTAQLEWVKIGSYFLDQENIYGKYPGHDLFNLRASQGVSKDLSVFARVTNLLDKRYADSASQSSANGGLYSPGLPRTVYAGVEAKF
jgi:outer membrane receptor protein involved in Fe transport